MRSYATFAMRWRSRPAMFEISPPPASRMHRQRRLWLPLGIAATLLILAGAWLASSRDAESGASASLSPSIGTAASPSQSPSKTLQGPVASEGPFPSEPEASLLAAMPADLAATCLQGKLRVDQRRPEPSSSGGQPDMLATTLKRRERGERSAVPARAHRCRNRLREWRHLGSRPEVRNQGWRLHDRQSGERAVAGRRCRCRSHRLYVEPTSGDAHLWWSYKDASILVEAVNQHGDAKDLRGYFETVARFIAQGFVAP